MSNYLPLWPDQASTMAGQVDALYIYLLLVSGIMTAIIFLAVAVLAIKYRRVPGRDAHQIEGSTILEVSWSVIPFFIMLTFFIWGAVIFFEERTPPADATEVYVVAKQWMWKIEHIEGQHEINELHVPTGQNIKLIMTSQDVIHSFYIPAFRLKQDVLPGRYTTLWFKATKPGRYHLFCAEYCGTMHSGMGGDIIVMEPQDYALWMAGGALNPLPETGKALFASLGCSTCHRSDVQGESRGPDLAGLYNKPVKLEDGRTVIADENYVRESILDPTAKIVSGFKPVMPTFQGIVNDDQLNALVAYIKSLAQPSSGQPSQGTAGLENQPTPAGQPQNVQVQ
ncbi:MAG TPA: cytochrome c oxidase subunit II [Terriglobales bacterium]|jgi:cytochrome c oxidase subunit 2|nr:cytochrome c oxidase subunit II [Terriglobales bacterium]